MSCKHTKFVKIKVTAHSENFCFILFIFVISYIVKLKYINSLKSHGYSHIWCVFLATVNKSWLIICNFVEWNNSIKCVYKMSSRRTQLSSASCFFTSSTLRNLLKQPVEFGPPDILHYLFHLFSSFPLLLSPTHT